MFQRVLWVSLTQALRSVALVLLPTAFIALVAWATAGSSNGNTGEPMKVAVWIWLAAHHVPFNLVLPPADQIGFFSYLPIGALLFPLLALRVSFIRAKDRLEQDERAIRLARLFIVVFYTSMVTLLAWGTSTTAVKPVLYWAPIASVLLVLLATAPWPALRELGIFNSTRFASRIMAIAIGVSSIVLGISLALNTKTIENLIVVLEPGWLGGVLLLLLNILYLPNAIIATFSYLVGPGFALGAGTLISPLTHRISEIPALPLLGALPTGRHPSVIFATVLVAVAGMLLYIKTRKNGFRELATGFIFIISSVALLAFLASGALMTDAMRTVGVSPWQLTAAIAVELGVGISLAWGIPATRNYVVERRGATK
ncbi:MAG TPA: DUF6350 family protein [Candidatus Paceibacterota bacterium]|nr:DUF6350 family protein [Candidatus Paceibacterota bacterium]